MSKSEVQEAIVEVLPAGVASKRWKGTLAIIYFTALINGYDVSNVANIQSQLHGEFGHIELLAWISLSYSLALFCVMFLVRQLTYHLDLRWLYLANLAIFLAGASVAGAAQSMVAVIEGRILMGVGGAFVQQINMFYVSICAPEAESQMAPKRIATMSASWAVGLIIGGPIGSTFSERVTWRWAFLLNLPCVGAALILACICVPSRKVLPEANLSPRQLAGQVAQPPFLLNVAVPSLLAVALTFCGSVWHWDSPASLGVWLGFGVASLLLVLYLWLTTADRSIVSKNLWTDLSMWSLWVGSACAGSAYAVSLYYLPLYFAFAKGADALEQTIRVLPFVLAFIISVALTGRALRFPAVSRAIYAVGGAVLVAAGVALGVILGEDTTTANVMGLEVLLGFGIGLVFQHSIGICGELQRYATKNARLDAIFMCNFAQMGGIATTVAAAGSIFQNEGYRLAAHAVEGIAVGEQDIRELLAGSSAKLRDQALLQQSAHIVSRVIGKVFFMVAAFGGVCLISGVVFAASTRRGKQPNT